MKRFRAFFCCIVLTGLLLAPAVGVARVMMTAEVNQFQFDILPTATFTVDDWMSNPNLWAITIMSDQQVAFMRIDFSFFHPAYGTVAQGLATVVGPNGFRRELPPGVPFRVNNTMFQEGKRQVTGGEWSRDFVDNVVKTGSLPEGWYTLRFSIRDGMYADGTAFAGSEDLQTLEYEVEIKNPLPPELVSPTDGAADVSRTPRFSWLRPEVNDLSRIHGTQIRMSYTITLWKMFDIDHDRVVPLVEEEAIQRDWIWRVEGLTATSVDFNPGGLRFVDELEVGRKYCWQIQAFDGIGRPLSPSNEGKSDLWQFTVQFQPPRLNRPRFNPLTVSWSPAEAGGMLFYRIRIADNPDFIGGFAREGVSGTIFTYPGNAPALRYGTVYYLELQATNAAGLAIGDPVSTTFELPPVSARAVSPADGEVIPGERPVFVWSGTGTAYSVTVMAEDSDWSYSSPGIRGTRWEYTGDPLDRGGRYRWYVTPVNDMGDRVGTSSATRSFTVPGASQGTLVSPVNEQVDTLTPVFVWDPAPGAGDDTEYTITITGRDGAVVQTATVNGTQYAYPMDAAPLATASRYGWSVAAQVEGREASSSAWFTTPFGAGGESVTMEEAGETVKALMGDFEGLDEIEDLTLVEIRDDSGEIDPSRLMDLLRSFSIVRVSVEE